MQAKPHPNQTERLQTLYSYQMLDHPREKDFDDIVALAAEICCTQVAVVNLIDADRQWFLAEVGLGIRETPLLTSICSHVILGEDFTEIHDTQSDSRMADNPLCWGTDGFRFYAGALLFSDNGLPVGTLCVLDRKPKQLVSSQRNTLKVLARQVMAQLEMRKALRSAHMLRKEVDHRVKNSLQSLSSLVRVQRRSLKTDEAITAITSIQSRIDAVATLHSLLYKSEPGSRVDLAVYATAICTHLAAVSPNGVIVTVQTKLAWVSSRQAVAAGTLINEFVSNSFKHAFPHQRSGRVTVSIVCNNDGIIRVICRDNGVGLPDDFTASEGTMGLKIAEIAAHELNTEIELLRRVSGFGARFQFQADIPQIEMNRVTTAEKPAGGDRSASSGGQQCSVPA